MSTEEMVSIPRYILTALEWTGRHEVCCSICSGLYTDGHKENCPIGIALKPKAVVPEVPIPKSCQHTMNIDGEKYRTEIYSGPIELLCRYCDLYIACRDGNLPDESNLCMAYNSQNPDRQERIWKKVAGNM